MSLTLRLMERWKQPDHLAVVHGATRVTYGGLSRSIRRAAGWLRAHEIQPGDVVALQMPKGLAFLDLHLALLALGAITLPLNDRYTAGEVHALLSDAKATLAILPTTISQNLPIPCVTPETARRELDCSAQFTDFQSISADTVGVLCYTSGTTGRAKGALIRQGNIQAMVQSLHQAWRWSANDILLHTLPLYHVHGLFVAQHGALYAGATAIWLDRFDAEDALKAISTHKITVCMGVPTHYHRLLKTPLDQADLSSVRLFTSGSAPLPGTVHRGFKEATGHEVVERYGMTEIGIVLSNPLNGHRKPGSVGIPLPGVSARVVDRASRQPLPPNDTGEVEISGPSVFAGYLNRPEATNDALVDGWMRTGDLGYRDTDGWFHLVGRASEMMITGGFNVYPAEVESVLAEQPGVQDVAVFGIPDPDLGERVCAAIVSHQPIDPTLLRLSAKKRLAAYKVPRSIFQVDELPRNTMGKILKRTLTTQFESTALP
ncbi:MAG: AMP-binding protein [Rhodobacterales bacterium]|nr:AMP-binding protein [Rhodobacterales bacterium]